ncbi:MAG: glycoside hydrolase family 3 N-terminal domain-containing protein [Chitinophagaceae bacterium]
MQIKNLKKYRLLAGAIMYSSTYIHAQDKLPQLGKSPVADVVKAMTLEEKASLVVGNGMYMPGVYVPGMLLKEPKGGQARVPGAAGSTFAIPRLGIPSIILSDGTASVNVWYNGKGYIHYATAWPTATLLASTWDTETLKKVGTYFGREVKAYGIDVVLAPAINLQRNPLGGRNYEYFSEDPLIIGDLSAAMIEGLQSNGIGACIKHFAANNQETNRQTLNTIVSERAMRELYLRGFEIAIKKSKPWTVMTSYNLINGTYTSERHDLVTDILRKEWGFKGFVMTDWGGGRDPVAQMKAGNNLLMPGTPAQSQKIIDAVKSGALSEKVLDKNVAQILNIIRHTITFNKFPNSNRPDLEKDAVRSKEAAEQGMVLLKNDDHALPFTRQVHIIALFGNSGYNLIAGGKDSENPPFKISLDEGFARSGYTVEQSIQTMYTNYLNAWKAKHPRRSMLQEYMNPTPPAKEYPISDEDISKSASNADIAVISIGQRTGEGADRKPADFYLGEKEKEMIGKISAAFHQAHKKVIVVLNIAAPIDVMQWRDQIDAILFAGEPGMEGGSAIAEILSGKVNPSGRLATTFPKKYLDVPSAKNFPGKTFPEKAKVSPMDQSIPGGEVTYQEGIYVGYRYFNTFNVQPAYEFGYGLSYTQFSFGKVKLSAKSFAGNLTASLTITNTGPMAGKEVVELYLAAPKGKIDKPSVELKGFAKTRTIKPGESQRVTFSLTPKDLASYNTALSSWIADAGRYSVKIGASSLDIKQNASFSLARSLVVEKDEPALTPQVRIDELRK